MPRVERENLCVVVVVSSLKTPDDLDPLYQANYARFLQIQNLDLYFLKTLKTELQNDTLTLDLE